MKKVLLLALLILTIKFMDGMTESFQETDLDGAHWISDGTKFSIKAKDGTQYDIPATSIRYVKFSPEPKI